MGRKKMSLRRAVAILRLVAADDLSSGRAIDGQNEAAAVVLEDYEETKFLSTPSARRATAKTETKSLFSNKLYNILHEFRRALIYNGSKSYPNHAK